MEKKPLKECPFCGGIAGVFQINERIGHGKYVETTYVRCTKCFAKGPGKDDWSFPNEDRVQLAIEAWNRRRAT